MSGKVSPTETFQPVIYSGTCLCGHHYKHHHLSMILNPEAYEILGPEYPGACLKYGCNEDEGLDEGGDVHCFGFVDVDDPDPERIAAWKGTRREA